MTARTAIPVDGGLAAYQWDGSEADAQGLVLWLIENDLHPRRCHYRKEHGVSFHKAVIELDGSTVLPGEWLVIAGGGMVIQMDEDQFGKAYNAVDQITIREVHS